MKDRAKSIVLTPSLSLGLRYSRGLKTEKSYSPFPLYVCGVLQMTRAQHKEISTKTARSLKFQVKE